MAEAKSCANTSGESQYSSPTPYKKKLTSCFYRSAAFFLYLLTNVLAYVLSMCVLGPTARIYFANSSFLSVLESVGVDIHLYKSGCILVMALCSLTIIITLLGIFGGACHNRCMLWTYFFLIPLLLLGFGVLAYAIYDMTTHQLEKPFLESLEAYDQTANAGPYRAITKTWDRFQRQFKCCGVDSWKDWRVYNDYFNTNLPSRWDKYYGGGYYQIPSIPDACCNESMRQDRCVVAPTAASGLYETGCYHRVLDEIMKHFSIIVTVAGVVLVSMALNGIFAYYTVSCLIANDSNQPWYPYGPPPMNDC